MIIIYNPDCSKCREAEHLLENNHCEIIIRNYLIDPLNETELNELIQKLGCNAEDLVRKNEKFFQDKFIGKKLTASDYLKILVEYPELLQRPIVMNGQRAIIGRPPVLVLDLIK